MTIKDIKAKGLKWASGKGCEMYLIIKTGEYQWWMVSEKTGTHLVTNKGLYGNAYVDERVKSHWEGFKKNQDRTI